ncbi:MAG TPA: beta-galactosidase [Candidatus Paceibacterota bacterium]|nr:beta-galactosidase [Candidatus Paceibacterota bacterium]HMO82876.1 beta-galactosidase [Candidatus Paceibacterota bacterium]
MPWWKIILIFIVTKVIFLALLIFFFAQKEVPENIQYGMSFNTTYATELGLDWQETYEAILGELGVRHLRLAAHWPMVEPNQGEYNFAELDYQISRAAEVGADVILGVGRRLPRWPECHIPEWVKNLSVTEAKSAQLAYMEQVVNRYKDSPAIVYWQVENEPFLEVFAFEHCGELDLNFFDQEIALVKSLDSKTPVLVTDSGNLGLWYNAYKRGDAFGTSVYVHFWNPELGQFRTLLPPFVYRVKENILAWIYGSRPTMLIELSAEPWLIAPVITVPIETQFTRMDTEKFADILAYAKKTRYETQYLWGAEWWFWLDKQGYPEMWEMGKSVYRD